MIPTTDPSTTRYHLIERIGRGTAGEVYLAEAEREISGEMTDRWPVAIKILARDVRPDDLLLYEAQKIKSLGNPRIVAPIDAIKLDEPHGSWAVVMEFVPGTDLLRIRKLLMSEGENPSPRAVFEIIAHTLAALAAAHSVEGRPALHRSLNPADVRLSTSGEVTLVDFAVHRKPTRHIRPPEQRGQFPVQATPQGDVYAAAAIGLWMFDGIEHVPAATEDAHHIDERLLNITHLLGPSLSGRTGAALLRVALATNPEDRPQAQALSEALADVAKGLAGEDLHSFAARIVPRIEYPRASEEGALKQLTPAPAPVRPVRRPNRTLALIGLLSTSLLTLITVLSILLGVFATERPLHTPAIEPMKPPDTPTIEAIATTPGTEGRDIIPEIEPPTLPIRQTPPNAPLSPPPPTEAKSDARSPVPQPRIIVEKAHFSVSNADSIEVRCGDKQSASTRSTNLKKFQGGLCSISATIAGQTYTTPIEITDVAQVRCVLSEGALSCQRE